MLPLGLEMGGDGHLPIYQRWTLNSKYTAFCSDRCLFYASMTEVDCCVAKKQVCCLHKLACTNLYNLVNDFDFVYTGRVFLLLLTDFDDQTRDDPL